VIPSRYRAKCEFCSRELNTQANGVYQLSSGWVQRRAGGGGHSISLPARANRWACSYCVESRAKGTAGQASMFDTDAQPSNARYDEEGHLIHESCAVCGADAPFGTNVNLRAGQLGTWYCLQHWPRSAMVG
jgi:hypothetical protein